MERSNIPGYEAVRMSRNAFQIREYMQEHTLGVRPDGQEYELGSLTLALARHLRKTFSSGAYIDTWNCAEFGEAIRLCHIDLRDCYTKIVKRDGFNFSVNTIFDANFLDPGCELAITRISASFVLATMRGNPKMSFDEAILMGHLFAAYLRDEVRSGHMGNNIAIPCMGDSKTEWSGWQSKFRVFVYSKCVAELGLMYWKCSQRLNNGKPLQAPGWLLKLVDNVSLPRF